MHLEDFIIAPFCFSRMPLDYLITVTSRTYYFEMIHLKGQWHQVGQCWLVQCQVGPSPAVHRTGANVDDKRKECEDKAGVTLQRGMRPCLKVHLGLQVSLQTNSCGRVPVFITFCLTASVKVSQLFII